MRIYLNVVMGRADGPVQHALAAVCSVAGHAVVDDPAQAQLIVTDSAADALGYLKDYEGTNVLVVVLNEPEGRVGAASLARQFPGRVECRPILEGPGEQNVVPYLMCDLPKEAQE